MAVATRTWLDRYAEAVGVDPIDEATMTTLLELAATAAHASERTAAPLSCWLAALGGLSPAEALERARDLAQRIDVGP